MFHAGLYLVYLILLDPIGFLVLGAWGQSQIWTCAGCPSTNPT